MQKLLGWIKLHKFIAGIIMVVLLAGGYFWYSQTHSSKALAQYVTGAAGKTTITVSVATSGQVSAENQVDLKPGSAGALTAVNVQPGDQVKTGQVIAVVDESNNYVSLAQARAQLLQAQANYDKLVAGLTGTDLSIAQRAVAAAQTAVDKAKSDYNQTVADQQLAVDRAQNKLLNSGLAATANDSLSTATVTLAGTYTGTTEGSYTVRLYETSGSGTYYAVSGLGDESGPVNRGYNLPLGNGLYINFSTTGTLNSASTIWTINVPNKTSSDYNTNLNAYNDALTNQAKALKAAQDSINSATDALTDAQLTFDQKTAAPQNSDVASAQAAVLSAQAAVQSASNNYNNNVLKAPFDGVVAALNNKKGDQVTTATAVATVITKQQLAQVSLNEVDVAKVKVGQKVSLTFDALENLELTGAVVEVGSLGTVTQGVVSYTVKIGFDTQDSRVKPGMSVTANIITDVKTDALAVPSSAVKTNANGKYVQILDAQGQPQIVPVEVGIANDTMTEITSGLTDGEKIVTQIITPTVAGTTTTRTNTTIIPGLGGGNRGAGGFGGGAGR